MSTTMPAPTCDAPSLAQMELWGAAMLRSMAGDDALQWSGQTLYQGTTPWVFSAAHHVGVPPQQVDQRGLIDSMGLRLSLSDEALHRQNLPTDAVERMVFELLEQLRVESLVPAQWPGARENMRQRFVSWCQAFIDSGLTESSLGILLFTVSITAWSRLTGHEIPDPMSDVAEATRLSIAPELGKYWVLLRRQREDQREFMESAKAVSAWVGKAVRSAQEDAPRGNSSRKRLGNFALPLHFESQNQEQLPIAQSGDSRAWASSSQSYRVFSREFDREVQASELVRAAQLAQFREQMDEELAKAGLLNVSKLARYLQSHLASSHHDGWQFAQEEGYLDGGRLAQIVSDPQQTAIFKSEMLRPINETAVTLLLDCSGSMKSVAQPLSLLLDVLGRSLEMAGVSVEILGFSTQAWNGGRARRKWQRSGQPQLPGRLNERMHLIFKEGSKRWRQSRHGIAALRKPDIFREGIDGEAVDWACQRLMERSAKRRILMVISDGCPMDTATHQTNDEHYLDQHLRQVIAQQERAGDIRICALGVGLDLGVFYRNRLAIEGLEHIDLALLHSIAEMICKP